ncbi:hypothetical protein C8Q77DRAFT_1142468 [Trametes polyzona]|nr:hypothetical protein C8Q77DRAFT_1142468 [Trametes polyzona]
MAVRLHPSATHTTSSDILSMEYIVEVAKEVIPSPPFICEWAQCHVELNSWKALQEHLHQHPALEQEPSSSLYQGAFECRLPKCAGRFHSTLEDIQKHLDLSHLSRVLLPCPIPDCPLHFHRTTLSSLPGHLRSNHSALLDTVDPTFTSSLPPLRKPRHPCLEPLPPLPEKPAFAFLFALPVVNPSRPQKRAASTSTQSRKRWKRMHVVQMTDEEPEDVPIAFGDLTPYDPSQTPELTHRVQRKSLEPALQQSRPQPMIVPPRPEQDPPLTIGYTAMSERFRVLEKAGIIDGSGVWPTEIPQGGIVGKAPTPGTESKKAAAGSL